MITDSVRRKLRGGRRKDDPSADADVLPAILLLARDIDELTERADALGLGMAGIRLDEAAQLCRREAPEPGTH